MWYWLILGLIGLATGIFGAMLGVGGSILLIPALNEWRGPQQHAHQATAMICTVFVAAPAAWRYARAGLVDAAVTRRLMPAAVLAVIGGVACSQVDALTGAREGQLVLLFGAFLVGVAGQNIWKSMHRQAHDAPSEIPVQVDWPRGCLIGGAMGFVAGLLGVGGGLIAVPLQQMLLNVPLKRAIANSTLLICAVGTVGAVHKNWAWAGMMPQQASAPLEMAAVLAPLVAIGSLLGAQLTTRLPVRRIRWIFTAVLLVAAWRQLSRGLETLG